MKSNPYKHGNGISTDALVYPPEGRPRRKRSMKKRQADKLGCEWNGRQRKFELADGEGPPVQLTDTQVLPKNNTINIISQQNLTSVLPREIEAAIEKHDRKQARVERSQGWGATTGGKALSSVYLPRLSTALAESLTQPRDRR